MLKPFTEKTQDLRAVFMISIFVLCFYHGSCPADAQSTSPLSAAVSTYQDYIGPIRHSQCLMYPSCSEYGKQVFERQQPVMALLDLSDRLMRCSHDRAVYPTLGINGNYKLLDLPAGDPRIEQTLLYSGKKRIWFTALDTTASMKFINHLIARQYYREALLEINRIMYEEYSPQSLELYTNFLVCKRALNEHAEGIYACEQYYPEAIQKEPGVLLEAGHLYLDLQNYPKAAARYNECNTRTQDPLIKDRSFLLLGISYAGQKDWNKSREVFLSVDAGSCYHQNAASCLSILEARKAASYRKPALAGTLSVIPGLGYLYAGHKGTALTSLFVNGLLMYACYSSIRSENYGLAALVGVVSLSFYIGTISGSAKAARRYNTRLDENFMNNLKSTINF